MTIQLTPEDEKLILEQLRFGQFQTVEEVIHHALLTLSTQHNSATPSMPRKKLIDVLSKSPFAGSELDLERIRDYPKPPVGKSLFNL